MSKYLYGFSKIPLNLKLRDSVQHRLNYFKSINDNKPAFIFQDRKFLFINSPSPNFDSTDLARVSIYPPGLKNNILRLLLISEKEEYISVSSDFIGDRTVWYYLDENWFLVSNSQFYIIRIIQSYHPNKRVWSWMLANGNLNNGESWDNRINAVAPEGSIHLSKQLWKVETKRKIWKFEYETSERNVVLQKMKEKLMYVASQYSLDTDKTTLNLSGGYDSRAVLFLLKGNHPGLKTSTWGISESFDKKGSDAYVARQVSASWGTKHSEFFFNQEQDFERILNKFLLFGEGRNDHLNSFMDGLKMWETLKNRGYEYVIRADEACGWLAVRTELDARLSVAMGQLSDFRNIPGVVAADYKIDKPYENFYRYNNEPIEDYRDRLYQIFRLPFVIGPLQDIPLNFAETINPLLHPDIVHFFRTLPPEFRTNKNLYAEWVQKLLPDIPFASRMSIPAPQKILASLKNKSFVESFLNDNSSSQLLGQSLMNYLKENYKMNVDSKEHLQNPLTIRFRKMVPTSIKKLIRNKITGYNLPAASLLLRAIIIFKMQKLLNEISK